MNERSITFRLEPKGPELSLPALIGSLQHLQRLVRDVDFAVTREPKGRVWMVEHIVASAPEITLRPSSDGAATVAALADGLRMIANDRALHVPPPNFDERSLKTLAGAAALFRGPTAIHRIVVKTLGVALAEIGLETVERVARVLKARGAVVLGSIEGPLERINWHGSRSFTIWDRMTGAPVTVYFGQHDDALIVSLAKQRVQVTGAVRYFDNGIPRSIVNVQDIRAADEPGHKPTLFGCIPGIIGAADSVAFVKAGR